MASGCRDCSRCTESCLVTLISLPFRIIFGIFALPLRAVQRKCPHCGHPLAWHSRRSDGSFKD